MIELNKPYWIDWPHSTAHLHFVVTREFIPQNSLVEFADHFIHVAHDSGWWVECATAIPWINVMGKFTRFPVYSKRLRPILPPEGDFPAEETSVGRDYPLVSKDDAPQEHMLEKAARSVCESTGPGAEEVSAGRGELHG